MEQIMSKKKEKIRTCIVTRETVNCEQMIRFVIGPNNELVPDLKGKLPGRGVWVTAERQAIEKACQRNLFAAGFKKKIDMRSDISEFIANLLLENIQNGLSIAKKSGLVITGFSKVVALARKGDISVLLHASDGREDGLGKIKSAMVACHALGGYLKGIPEPFILLSSAQMDQALGMGNSVHVALTRGGATRNLKKQIIRLKTYLQ